MSASEKLKALDGELADYDTFVRALPQIVALVEAAEQLPDVFQTTGDALEEAL